MRGAVIRPERQYPVMIDLASVTDDQDVNVALLIEDPCRCTPIYRDREAPRRHLLDSVPESLLIWISTVGWMSRAQKLPG